MPPKSKKLPAKVEQNSKALSSTLSTISSESTRSGLTIEAEDRFEVELLWCIQQLQTLLIDGKMTDKQLYIASKNLNTLKSNSASLIKKRQIMRNTFGDYRAKMSEDEKKYKKSNSTIKFTSPTSTKNNSTFLKKSHIKPISDSNLDNESQKSTISTSSLFNSDVTNEPFKFNFTQPED
ncbi:UPF0488 protein CG14286 [Leptopilina boulardi]|uniref:UPF0488 protein CG14286 n=1 Tax=Leptopilina boulardi TaxID=63433 RepID=UPI0021F59419|nr:UPF0488 protein CG14286 [Leptopilina boulardi]